MISIGHQDLKLLKAVALNCKGNDNSLNSEVLKLKNLKFLSKTAINGQPTRTLRGTHMHILPIYSTKLGKNKISLSNKFSLFD